MATWIEYIPIGPNPAHADINVPDLRGQRYDPADGTDIGAEVAGSAGGFFRVSDELLRWSGTFDDADGSTQGFRVYLVSGTVLVDATATKPASAGSGGNVTIFEQDVSLSEQ